jgi:protein-S-isoprenylcysteine O-methyltransferase Ste14
LKSPGWFSIALVGVQFVAIGSILATGPLLARAASWRIVEIISLVPGCWAILQMLPGKFNVFPEVRDGASLVTHGPYRWIRHPMYTTVLGTMLALVLDAPDAARGIAWIVLFATLLVKTQREERLLRQSFPQYADYARRTRRFLPYIF